MIRAFVKPCTYASIALLLLVLCPGCAGRRSDTKQQFVVEATRGGPPARQRPDVVLAVRDFAIDPVCDSRGLMYRKGQSEYETDFYHEFLVAPQALVGRQTRNWLSQSGMFRTVPEMGSLIEPTHILEGNVLVLHGDFRDRNRPQAVIQIRVFLVANKRSQPEVVFTRDYRAMQAAEAVTADALIAAFDRCLEQILSALEEDLGKVL